MEQSNDCEGQMKTPVPITPARFAEMLTTEFPEVVGQFTRYEKGLLHCEMGSFRQAVEQAMDTGQFWMAERAFRFIEWVSRQADPEVHNAIEVSFLEDLGITDARHKVVTERMPQGFRARLLEIDDSWK